MNEEESDLTPSQDFIFLSLIGLLSSAADQIPHGRLYLRHLQLVLLSKWRPHWNPRDREIPLPESLLREVWKFWESEIRLNRGVLLHPPPPKLSMFTDASNFGWGAHVNEVDLFTKGTWSQEESMMSINIL
jgi:hypothetical protein